MNKKILIVGIAVFLACLILIPSTIATDNWTIDGDTVYVDDVNVYLSATPHTINSSGWVYFNVTTKNYTGDIDVLWGFDGEVAKPSKPQVPDGWINKTSSTTFINVTSFEDTSNSCEYGHEYNTYKKIINYQINKSAVVCFDSYSPTPFVSGGNYTISWHIAIYRNWEDISPSLFSSFDYEYQGMNKWYYIKNVSVVAGQSRQVRAWINVPISTEEVSGKYWWALKPSSKSISQAIADNHFYYLDPWYNSSWSHRKQWTVTNVNSSTLTNYPAYINVTDEPEMQADWDDVVFTDSAGNLIAYELENYTTGFADYWVNISSLPGSGTYTGWLYYGNDGASSQENPEGVYDNYTKMVQHLQEAPANDVAGHLDSTSNNNDGTPKNFNGTAASTTNGIGKIDGADTFDGVNDYIDCGDNASLVSPDTLRYIELWIKFNDLSNRQGIITFETYISWLEIYPPGNLLRVLQWNSCGGNNIWLDGIDKGSSISLNSLATGKWYHIVYSTCTTVTATNLFIGGKPDPGWFNGTIDEVRIYNRALSADEINQSYELVVNQSTWVSWGSIQYDTTFTVTLPVGYTYAHFNLTGITNPSTQTNYAPEGQNSTTAFYNVTNTGSSNLTIRMNINSTITNIILKADTDNNPIGAKEINTTFAILYTNLSCDNSINIWLWTNLSHAVEQTTNRTLEVNVTKS